MIHTGPFPITHWETFITSAGEVQIPGCYYQLKPWEGNPLANTFGGKPVVSIQGKPGFAEVAIANEFELAGWESRWLETYARPTLGPMLLKEWRDFPFKEQTHVPITHPEVNDLLKTIAVENGNTFSGCWDVLAWKDGHIVFAESKRHKQDKIQSTQIRWLEAAMRAGIKPEQFLVIQWEFGK